MEKLLDYSNDVKGYLEVIKVYPDGREEIHFSDENIITSGMGKTLLNAFKGGTGSASAVDAFQIIYFQCGSGGSVGLQVSTTGALGGELAEVDYGTANFELDTHNYLSSTTTHTNKVFGVIPFPYINKISPTRVMYNIFLGDNACDGVELDEIGLFSKNPIGTASPETSLLCAYRYFTPLTKATSFSVLFKWTIEF